MARLRLLFALLLMGLGTWFGALALSGYYEPRVMQALPDAAATGPSEAADASRLASLASRQRFVAVEAHAPAPPAKPKMTKPAAKPKPPAATRRPQQAAAQLPWPLNLLSN
jgi:hypothetical protein